MASQSLFNIIIMYVHRYIITNLQIMALPGCLSALLLWLLWCMYDRMLQPKFHHKVAIAPGLKPLRTEASVNYFLFSILSFWKGKCSLLVWMIQRTNSGHHHRSCSSHLSDTLPVYSLDLSVYSICTTWRWFHIHLFYGPYADQGD